MLCAMNLTGVHLDNLNIAFHKAVEAQDYAKILFLFDAGANVNSKVHGGKSMPMSFMNRGPMLDGRFAPRWCNSMEYGTEYVWSPDDPWEEDTRTKEDFRQGVAISLSLSREDHDGRMGITALMRAAAVGDSLDTSHAVQRGTKRVVVHPRHWVIRLLLMLGADPKIPGGWTRFGESILEFLSMHPSRLSSPLINVFSNGSLVAPSSGVLCDCLGQQ